MKNVVLASNPYRDKNFQTARRAVEILKETGLNLSHQYKETSEGGLAKIYARRK